MFISKAYAQVVESASQLNDAAGETVLPAAAPSATEAFLWNMGMVAVLVALFYVLLIRPQQKRFKEHSVMLQGLKKGDKVVTGGGLVGTIAKITDGVDDVEVDLGNGLKVTALRSTLQTRAELAPLAAAEKKAAAKK